jgi:hypothetical protein
MACPDFETLIDCADGRLAGEERALVESHVAAGCEACSAALAWYAAMTETAAADTSVEPPPWVTRRAIGLFREAREAAGRRGLRGVVARIRAALVFDSLAGLVPDALPARNAASSPTRQLLYAASPFDIDLLISGAGPSLSVTGQVLASGADDFEGVAGLLVELEHNGRVSATSTSEFGEFTIDDVAPGVYDLRLVGGTREIVLSSMPVSVD